MHFPYERESIVDTSHLSERTRLRLAKISKLRARGLKKPTGDCEAYLKRRLARDSSLTEVQPISFMSRSTSVRKCLSARSTPA